MTVPYDPVKLRQDRDEMWYALFAAGIDFQRCIVFEQSSVRLQEKKIKRIGAWAFWIDVDFKYIDAHGWIESNDAVEGLISIFWRH
jgi:hypothetical protein